ncbi:MAG: TIGR01212 family radical SAM protein [Firmicutes bacterium HGW-Firmicutes-1]|nr:MAG: TIGR01212 family radical SAM protein [Firmicutes bacterium HGW-Firmicutes-1]
MNEEDLYYKYSYYLKQKYGEKVYKLPVNLNISCPNRDGTVGTKGCYFCSDKGTGFEMLHYEKSVREQLIENRNYIGKRYGANKFIAYFQNYTNTYMPLDEFKLYMEQACMDDVVEIDVSTRPDCISREYLDVLQDIYHKTNTNITIELGLQTTNDESLIKINRGHNVQDFIDAVNVIKEYPFDICVHLILNLPWDEDQDAINSAILMNQLAINQVKLHALYIAKGSVFERMYAEKNLEICSKDEYISRVILFLENLDSSVAIQRLIGRAPKEETAFCNWDISWWKIRDEIDHKMKEMNTYQGKKKVTYEKRKRE